MEQYSGIENEIVSFAAIWMGQEIVILSEVSQIEKDKYHMIAQMWNLKNYETEPNTKQKQNPQSWSTQIT